MNRIRVIAIFASAIILLSFGAVLLNLSSDSETFYVGVSYCGESVEEAKLLIDRVKDYTNLFVLQSGPLQIAPDTINEIIDYAVSSGMNFMVFFGDNSQEELDTWLKTGKDQWDDHFLGVYYADEPGGKMLDSRVQLNKTISQDTGVLTVSRSDGITVLYFVDGRAILITNGTVIEYETNGEIRVNEVPDIRPSFGPSNTTEDPTNWTSHQGSVDLSQVESYEDLWDSHPFPTHESIADFFINEHQSKLEYLNKNSIRAFTSDYALYWFDYKAGYDTVFAEVGWNHTLAQDIALARGAAKLQNKKWGAIITWKYNHPPYLDSGEAIYKQMRTAYETGAEYVVIFNYAEDMEGPYGTLQDEHFVALEQFWNDVVHSSEIEHGSVNVDTVLVLPENYGWGMRRPDDKIWGLWEADEKSPQIWELSRNLLEQYDLGLDIVYEDSEFPVEREYENVIYWNQTN
ncbi:hypothetical protein ACFLRN_08455 [Thermoproteota archaeon]